MFYFVDAIVFSMVYGSTYFLVINSGFIEPDVNGNPSVAFNILGLMSGLANGLAMTLLFGKYRSIEHSIGRIDKVRPMNIVYLGTAFILPIYTLAQPLFGSFQIATFGPPEIFANCVFFICLIGKIFFLYFTYTFLQDKLFHLHLHMLITSKEIPPSADKCFDIFNKDG